MKYSLFLIWFLLYPDVLSAYNTKNHEMLTQHAIYLLNLKFGADFISNEEAQMIIKGNTSEDKNVFKGLTRWWNQHFYNPAKDRIYWKRNKSIDVRFERIAKRCFEKRDAKKYYKYVGEIIHHIQDVTNPSHVVPVYHGLQFKDKFDEHYIGAYLPVILDINTKVTYDDPYHLSILDTVARETLLALNKTFEIQICHNNQESSMQIDWTYFWIENPKDWFGEYGFLGAPENNCNKIDNYLSSQILKGDTFYMVSQSTYSDFSSRQVALAVNKTAQFLYFAKGL